MKVAQALRVKVATRITAATAVVVALACAAYAFFDLRSRAAERRDALEREARGVASTLRLTLEPQASAFRAPSDAQLDELSRATGGWRVDACSASARAASRPGPSPSAQLERLRTMLDVPVDARFAEVDDDTYYYALALRAAGPTGEEPQIARHARDQPARRRARRRRPTTWCAPRSLVVLIVARHDARRRCCSRAGSSAGRSRSCCAASTTSRRATCRT